MVNQKPTNTNKFPPEIRAIEEKSFAKHTLLNRFPHIINQIIDDNNYDQKVIQELKSLADEVLDGKIKILTENSHKDTKSWNECIALNLNKSWFEVSFFFAEMYFYRRILEATNYFKDENNCGVDPYSEQKLASFSKSIQELREFAEFLNDIANTVSEEHKIVHFDHLLISTIWANRADLSQLPNVLSIQISHTERFDSNSLLINDISKARKYILEHDFLLNRIDIILDNAGMELLCDLGLVDYLLSSNLVNKVFIHCKSYPIFVSDATSYDVHFTLNSMREESLDDIREWGGRLSAFVREERLCISEHPFWTLPYYFRDMPESLHRSFSESELILIKGDANYRRLVDDRHWNFDTPISLSVDYLPTYCLALRVLKSELLLGVGAERLRTLNVKENWMTCGEYGLVQFIDPQDKYIDIV